MPRSHFSLQIACVCVFVARIAVIHAQNGKHIPRSTHYITYAVYTVLLLLFNKMFHSAVSPR